MSVFRKFERNDIFSTVVHARPRVLVKYDENGWGSNVGVSASLSLYPGVRSRRDVKSSDYSSSGISIYPIDPVDTHSIDKVIFVSGSYPSTGSIRYVRCFDSPAASFTDITESRWYEEHFRPISILYDYYSRIDSNYFIGNYDFYCAYLPVDSSTSAYSGSAFPFINAVSGTKNVSGPTSSFTVEAWIKPLKIGSTFANNPTIMCQIDAWNMKIDDGGSLCFGYEVTGTLTYVSGTSTVEDGKWNHVAVVVSSSASASFWVNGVYGGSSQIGALQTGSLTLPHLVVGAYIPPNGNGVKRCFNGFLFETRLWNRQLSGSEIQLNASGTLFSSGSSNLIHYGRFNDGPLSTTHGYSAGSGAFDYSSNAKHAYLYVHSYAHTCHWTPNDHPTFVTKQTKINTDINEMRVVHVPSLFYGRQIEPGTVTISDGTYNSQKIVRVFNDDGKGGLYVSGSMTKAISGEDYTGEKRRKVGNVFYSEGIITLTDPALRDMMDVNTYFWDPTIQVSSGVFGDLLSVDFRGNTRTLTKVFNCRAPSAQVNASNNSTFSYRDTGDETTTDDDRTIRKSNDGTVWITAVGLYNEERKLVAVAKLAQPIRKREKDRLNIKLKYDF